MALVNERLGLKKMLDTVRAEIGKHQQNILGGGQSMSPSSGFSQGVMNVVANPNAQLGTIGAGDGGE